MNESWKYTIVLCSLCRGKILKKQTQMKMKKVRDSYNQRGEVKGMMGKRRGRVIKKHV